MSKQSIGATHFRLCLHFVQSVGSSNLECINTIGHWRGSFLHEGDLNFLVFCFRQAVSVERANDNWEP